jgi:exopolyphosphatase/guanosine-5'-triphosphate,3'-diphosphate pyrophosphatase
VAVIDIGTNTLLLLVAEVEQRDNRLVLTAVRDTCEFGRLGQGLDKTGALAADAIERSLAIARRYRAVIDELKVDTVCAVGTQALREAGNASEFVAPAEKILGVPIEVIAGEREAELVFRAVSESFPELARFVIADVGGGSTEIIAAAGALTQVESFTSLPIGSVRLHERHLHADPPTPAQVQALVAGVDDALASVVATLPKGVCLVGTAGTATTIGSVELKLRSYDPDKIQGLRLPVEVVERQLARYLELTLGERRHMPGLPPERADVIAAGTAIYARLLHHLEASAFVISDRGVRWGLAYELAATGAQ